MAIKVQGSAVPTIQTQQTQQAPQAQQQAPQAGIAPGGRDEFVGLPPDLGGILRRPPVTLNLHDRMVGSNLAGALSSPFNSLLLAFGKKTETVHRDADGTYRGPEGQPLVQVRLKDGNTAYVDPNTNQYYLTDGKPDKNGNVKTLPARPLPKGSQFSNSYFSDADVKELTRLANRLPIPIWPPLHTLDSGLTKAGGVGPAAAGQDGGVTG